MPTIITIAFIIYAISSITLIVLGILWKEEEIAILGLIPIVNTIFAVALAIFSMKTYKQEIVEKKIKTQPLYEILNIRNNEQ